MKSLFNVAINWYALIGAGIVLLLLAPGISIYCFIGLMIAAFQFLLVFYSFDYVIPVRYIAGALMSLQMLVGPAFAYMGLDDAQYFKYKMQVSEQDYFLYAIPAVCCFIVGLHINSKLRGEIVNEKAVKQYVSEQPKMLYILIIIGFLSSVINTFFSSAFDLVFYLLSSAKYIGAFMLIIGGVKLKPWILVVVFGSIVLSSLGSAMFHDLITWLIFILAVLAIKFKPPVLIKVAFAVGFMLLVITIQQLKGAYRTASQFQGKQGSLDLFGQVYETQESNGGIFDKESLARNNVRINQGFIVTYIMKNIPDKVPYANGAELYQILEAAFLPRIIAPNKLKAGDNSLVTKYSGIRLNPDTSMSLSAMGDSYINFGTYGGCIMMFFLGALFNFVLIKFGKIGKKYPVAILFTPLVFYFPIRPDTALQTGLNHLVKASFLLYMILIVYRHQFEVRNKIKRKEALIVE